MGGVIVPRSRGGDEAAGVIGLPLLDAEQVGLEPVVRGLGVLSQDVEAIGLAIKEDEDRTRVFAALSEGNAEYQSRVSDPETGLFSRRGENALKNPDRSSVFDEGVSIRKEILGDMLEGLGNDTQKRALQNAWLAGDRHAIRNLSNHMLREQKAYRDQTNAAFIAVQSQLIATTDNDEERAEAILSVNSMVDEMQLQNGWSEDHAEVMVRRSLTAPLETAIRREALSNPQEAQQLFEDLSGFIDATRHDEIAGAIDRSSLKILSQAETDRIMLEAETLPDRLELARAIEDPDVRDEAVRRVRDRTNEQTAARVEVERVAVEASWEGVLAGKGEESIHEDVPAATRRQILQFIGDRAETAAKGKAFKDKTDPMEWDRLTQMRINEPDKFSQLDLWSSRPKLARAEFNEFIATQKALRTGTDEEKRALEPGDTKFANDSMRIAGITDPETLARGRFAFERAARELRNTENRDLTLTEREDLFKRILKTELDVPGFAGFTFLAFGEKKNVAELTADDVQALIENPSDELSALGIKGLKKQGVLEPNVEQLQAAIAGILKRLGAPDVE